MLLLCLSQEYFCPAAHVCIYYTSLVISRMQRMQTWKMMESIDIAFMWRHCQSVGTVMITRMNDCKVHVALKLLTAHIHVLYALFHPKTMLLSLCFCHWGTQTWVMRMWTHAWKANTKQVFESERSQSSSWLNNKLETKSNTGLTWWFFVAT